MAICRSGGSFLARYAGRAASALQIVYTNNKRICEYTQKM